MHKALEDVALVHLLFMMVLLAIVQELIEPVKALKYTAVYVAVAFVTILFSKVVFRAPASIA
jgi:hypothetical protein